MPKFEAIRWPDDKRPSRTPIHFTNELEVDVPPETVWRVLTDLSLWPRFYPHVTSARLLDGRQAMGLGARFQAGLAGQDVLATVAEFEPTTRIAWTGGPKSHPDATAYHAWIFTPTATGTHLWTEETMQGPLWLEIAKQAPDRFWADHEALLRDLARTAQEQVKSGHAEAGPA